MPEATTENPAVTRLTELGVIRPRGPASEARNQVIGCVGCRLANAPDGQPEFTTQDVAQCLEIHYVQVLEVLKRLTKADVFTARKIGGRYRQVYYRLADSPAGQALRETVVAIGPCQSVEAE